MKKTLVSLFVAALLAAPSVALAQFQLFPGEAEGAADYRVYIQNFYRFSIAAGILIATVLIMIGGIMWVTSAGDRGRVDKAMDYIKDSIIGVVLLIGAYTILSLINPKLVNLPKITFPKLSLTAGACLTQEIRNDKTGKLCTDMAQSQCNQIKNATYAGDGETCEKACPKKDTNGFCMDTRSETDKTVAENRAAGKSDAQSRCEIQDNFGRGYMIDETETNVPLIGDIAVWANGGGDNDLCTAHCNSAGANCVLLSATDEGKQIRCRCTYTGSNKK